MNRKTMELLLENYVAMLNKMSGTPLQNTRERQRIEKLKDELKESQLFMLNKLSGTPLQRTCERARIQKLKDELYERLSESEPTV